MNELIDLVNQSGQSLLTHLVDPNKRLYWGYLVSSICFALWVYYCSNSKQSIVSYLFNRKIWLSQSGKLDIKIWLINIVIKTTIILPLLFAAGPLAIEINNGLNTLFGDIRPVSLNANVVMVSFTLILFLLDDFSRFLLHWLLHKVPFLWHLHKVHHSAETMTPITVYRIHPLESALFAMRLVFVQALALAIGFYLFGHKLSLWQIGGANIGVWLFNMFAANLRHSHLYLAWWPWLENWFISPAQHQIHHSKMQQHYDKNFGSALAIWDRLFGTLVLAKTVKSPIQFGLQETTHHNLSQSYLKPLYDICLTLIRRLKTNKY